MSTPRTPVTLVKMTMDWCANSFGVAPCTATGKPCYNTFPTCKARANYVRTTRDYKFTSSNAPPALDGTRPYLKSVKLLPTEIKTNLTVSGRVSIEMADEPDGDVGIDPYVTQRENFPDIQGTFWRKFLARNRNFRARQVRVYEGWLGYSEEEFALKWLGSIENVTLGSGVVKMEAADQLAGLGSIEIPAKVDLKLVDAIAVDQTAITVTDNASGLDDAPSYIKIGDEVIAYSGIDFSNGVLTGLTRGTLGTTAAEAGANAKVGKVRYFPPDNPFNHLRSMLLDDAGVNPDNVDSAGIDVARDVPGDDLSMWTIVDVPTKLNDVFFGLTDLLDCKAWVNEDMKITVRRNLPNDPTWELRVWSDEANIVDGTPKVDGNEKSRLSRCYLYWDKPKIGKVEDPAQYRRLDLGIDADSESANDYGNVVEKKAFSRWLHTDGFVEEDVQRYARVLAMRQVWRNRDASPIISFDVEVKDADVRTGDYVVLETDEIVDIYGNPVSGAIYQIVKREAKGAKVSVSLIRVGQHRMGYCHLTDNPNPWESATDEEKKYAYASATEDGLMPDGSDGYYCF